MLKSQDVVTALYLVLPETPTRMPYAKLAGALHMSVAETHASVGRLALGRLVDPIERKTWKYSLRNFLVYGIRHVFPFEIGGPCVGIAAAWLAPAFAGRILADITPVWPCDGPGVIHGNSLTPLSPLVGKAAAANIGLHNLLGVADMLRGGSRREIQLAIAWLDQCGIV